MLPAELPQPAGTGENPTVSTMESYGAPQLQGQGNTKIPPQLVPRDLP